jgi:hypothetical protein
LQKFFAEKGEKPLTKEQLIEKIAHLQVINEFHYLADQQPIFIVLFATWINERWIKSQEKSPEALLAEIKNRTQLVTEEKQFFKKKLIDSIPDLLGVSGQAMRYLAAAYRRMTSDILSWLLVDAATKELEINNSSVFGLFLCTSPPCIKT